MTITKFNLVDLKRDLTGPRAFASGAFLVFVPLYFLFSVLLGTKFSEPWTALAAIASNVVSLSSCAIVFGIFSVTVFRNRLKKPVSIVWLLIAGAILGFTKGYVTGLMMWQFGADSNLIHAITSRVYSTTVLGVLLVITQPILLTFRDRFKGQRDTLVAERVKIAATPREELQQFTAEARQRLNSKAGERVGFLRSSDLLRRIIQDDLRPLSHKIWEQENARYTDFTFKDLYRLAVTKYSFPWGYVAPIYFITAIGAFVPPYGLLPGLTFDFIVSLSIIFCFAFARIFSPKNVVIASIYTVFVVSIAAYLGGTAAMMILSIRLNDEYLVSMIGNGAWILELTITGALIMAAFRSHLEIERELVQLVGADAASKNKELLSAQIANRELAQYLHGHVQNQLLASALRLEQAENSNNEMEMRKELEAVDKLLEEAPKGIRSGSSGSLTHELRSIERLWTGLLEVQIEVDETCEKLDLGPNMIHDLTQAVNESITNALRHGFASRVAVSVRAKSGNIELVCSDNGTGPRSGGAGLGSALYSSLAGTRWSLEPAIGGGSVLTVKVKV